MSETERDGEGVASVRVDETKNAGELREAIAPFAGGAVNPAGNVGHISPEDMQSVLALTPDLVTVVDFKGNPLWRNAAFHRLVGSDAALTAALGSFVLEADRPRYAIAFERLLDGKEEIVGEELRMRALDGSYKWYSWLAQVDHKTQRIHAIGREITFRRRIADALERSERELRTLIDHAPDFISVTTEGRIVYANAAAMATLGDVPSATLEGRAAVDLVHPDDRETFEDLSVAYSAAPKGIRLLRADDSFASVEVSAVRVEFDGAPSILYIARDLSERKRLEQQLLQADRMAQVGTLAAGVAHEINNPLAYVVANLSFLADELPVLLRELAARRNGEAVVADPRARKAPPLEDIEQTLAEAREGADRVRLIVSELKAFSRPSDDATESIDVRDVLDSTCNIAWNEIRHRARLVKSYGEVPLVSGNASRLGQVFLNLLVNAAHAITPGDSLKNEIKVLAYTEGTDAIVEVKDTGCGIPRNLLRRIFDPFYTMKPVGVGTGLGLSICLTIVRGIGGEISVDSEVGQGATFRVRLPGRRPDSARVSKAVSSTPKPGGVSRPPRTRILIVDDEPAVAASLRRALGREHEVTLASSSEQALQILSEELFDVILCDVYMPQMTGLDLYDIVTSERPELADTFLFMSGGVDSATRTRLSATTREVIDKPFAINDLRAILKKKTSAKQP